jgi:RHS repeat-associated protein
MPKYPGLTLGAGWTKGIAEQYDAMGNVSSISRADAPGASGAVVMSATYRNAGRPDRRTITTAGGSAITRTYAYDATTAQLKSVSVSNANGVIAGSEVTYDGLQKASARLLGLASGERHQLWSYDARSRVAASLYGVKNASADANAPVPGRAKEDLNPADFRNAQEREPALDAATRIVLAEKQIDSAKIDPPTATFTEQSGHKVAEMTKGPQVRPFAYQGAERIDDGRFTYEFDVKGRLVRSTEKASVGPIRSIAYSYSGMGRLIGRRAEYSSSATALSWQLEDRPQILAADGLPAETTFVWDAITDRLVSVFRAGANSTDAHGGLLKQIIHGDASYDDPVETATIDPSTGAVTHLYPIYDEAGAGSLQAIVNRNGEVVARNLSKEPYGAEDVAMAGAAVYGVKVEVQKADGNIERVTVTLHATEELSLPTVATGARLATVDANGAVVRTATVTPIRVGSDTPTATDDDAFALQWTLTPAQWSALTDPATLTVAGQPRTPAALSVAATSTLRATNWSADLALLPAPTWVTASKPVFSTPALPVEVRESLTSLTTFITTPAPTATATSPLYAIDSLPLLGNPAGADDLSEDIVSARMHAHPFTEPMTRLNYVRNRWFDPETGTWLSPDPLGYRDSSNLYAFCGGDPVNCTDPLGLAGKSEAAELEEILRKVQAAADEATNIIAKRYKVTPQYAKEKGLFGTQIHKVAQQLLSDKKSKFYHPRILTEVEVDTAGTILRYGPRSRAAEGSLVKDIVVMKPGMTRKVVLTEVTTAKHVTELVIDLKTGLTGADPRQLDTLDRFGVTNVFLRPFENVAFQRKQSIKLIKRLNMLKGLIQYVPKVATLVGAGALYLTASDAQAALRSGDLDRAVQIMSGNILPDVAHAVGDEMERRGQAWENRLCVSRDCKQTQIEEIDNQ